MDIKLSGIVGESLQTWEIPEGKTLIGRSSELDVSLPDRSVSRHHAAVRREGDTLQVEDVGSRNGTSVNGVRIQGPHPLKPDDRVSFGNVTLRLVTEDRPIQPALTEHTQLDSTFKLNWKEIQEAAATESRETSEMFQVLTDLGEFLVRHQPQEEIFEACLDSVEKLVPFQRACLLLLDDAGSADLRAARFKGENSNLELALSQTMVQTVISERASLLVRDAQSDARFQLQESVILGKIRSALVAPLFDNTQVIGVLYADTSELTAAYDKQHLRRLALLANILAVKITNARLLEVQREKERMQQEMETAEHIQRTMLLSEPDPPEGYELDVRLEPCTEVGGDLYDVITLPDGRWVFVLGDVVGHGVGAAMLMTNAMAGIRALAELCDEPVELVRRLHAQMCHSTDPTSYVTMFVAFLDLAEHRLDYVNAGHEAPVLLAPDGSVVHLNSTGPPVGLIPGLDFASETVAIPPGSLLCAWSDGITEAHVPVEDGDPDLFGEHESLESIVGSLRDRPVKEITNEIFDRVDNFLNGGNAPDDRTLLILRRNA
jgi:serine phosphatase RsbU (regulator of sigma subunit)